MITKFKHFLNESPDGGKHPNGGWEELNWQTVGSAAFGTYNSKVYISAFNGTHYEIQLGMDITRSDYENCGRLWSVEKVISFWNVDGVTKLSKIIDDINEELKLNRIEDYNFQIDDTWDIEVLNKAYESELYNLYDFIKIAPFGYNHMYSVEYDNYKGKERKVDTYGNVVDFDIKDFLSSYKVNDKYKRNIKEY